MARNSLILIAACFWLACNKDTEYIDSIPAFDNANIAKVDTLNVVGLITCADSMQTSGMEYFKMGLIKDPEFGATNCMAITAMGLPAGGANLDGNYYFDSLVLTILPGRSWQGDSTESFHLEVKRLAQDLITESGFFYNHYRFSTYQQALGSKVFMYRPSIDDTMDIRLDDDLGKTLFNFFKTNDPVIRSDEVFKNWFKGIEISMQANGNGMLFEVPQSGSGIRMRLYYHLDNGRIENTYFDFSFNSVNAYTFMETNRTGTSLAVLDGGNTIPLAAANPLMYCQSLTDVRTEFSFPGIKELLKKGVYFSLVEARLIVKPKSLENSFFPYPAQLNIYYKDIAGVEAGPVTDAQNQTLDGDFYNDIAYPINSYYSFDVTSYVQNELTGDDLTSLKLVLRNGNYSGALSRLVTGLPGNSRYSTKLIITYLTYNP